VQVTDGPYAETKEHMSGFWILEAAHMDEALAWVRKGAISCDAAGEVCASFFSTRLRNKNPAKASNRPGQCALRTRAWLRGDALVNCAGNASLHRAFYVATRFRKRLRTLIDADGTSFRRIDRKWLPQKSLAIYWPTRSLRDFLDFCAFAILFRSQP